MRTGPEPEPVDADDSTAAPLADRPDVLRRVAAAIEDCFVDAAANEPPT